MRWLCLVVFLVSCGADDGGGGASLAPTDEQRVGMGDDDFARLVPDQASLPACDDIANGRLVYVKADAAFMTCDAGAWTVIDLRGPKGDAGVAGADGAKGEAGSNGEDGLSASGNLWQDPITSALWSATRWGGFNEVADMCEAPWRQPTKDDLVGAYEHQIAANIDMATGGATWLAWTDENGVVDPAKGLIINLQTGAYTEDTKINTAAGIYCVRDSD